MRTINEKLESFTTPTGTYLKLGLIMDGIIRYFVFTSLKTGKIYIEQVYTTNDNINIGSFIVNLKQIDNEEEWKTIFKYVTTQTTILSEKRLNKIFGVVPHKTTLDPKLAKKFGKRNKK